MKEDGDLPDYLQPIPRELYSEYEERPFLCCTRCGETLADFEEGYKISKIFKRGEVIFEYALCFPCIERMMEDSSVESREKLEEFQEERLREVEGTDECCLCTRTRVELDPPEFSLMAGCQFTGMIESNLVCNHCMEEMNSLVSEKTRDEWNRFVQENFPGPPADVLPAPTEGTPTTILL